MRKDVEVEVPAQAIDLEAMAEVADEALLGEATLAKLQDGSLDFGDREPEKEGGAEESEAETSEGTGAEEEADEEDKEALAESEGEPEPAEAVAEEAAPADDED
jgi:hypothetical protein